MIEIELSTLLVKFGFIGGFVLATLLFALIAGVLLAARHAEMRFDMELMEERLRDMERKAQEERDREGDHDI